MQLTESVHTLKKATIEALRNDRLPHWNLWRELANFYISRRYIALQSGNEMTRVKNAKNPYILDGTGTIAARVLASGMMNGVTSPGRPWFKLRIAGQPDEVGSPQRIWLDEVARRMMMIMSESNFYNALAVLYLDLVVFGSAAMIIYEDYDNVIHCYNPALGEFYFAQSDKLQVNTFARDLTLKVHQIVQWFGIENVSITTKEKYQRGGAQAQADVELVHLIEPNDRRTGSLPLRFSFREYYWEKGAPNGLILSEEGFHEIPGIFPRWELAGNEAYGSSSAMDALGDVIQLQHMTKRKAQGLDKLISPPVIADVQLQHRPTALLPNGITFVNGINNVGVKPAYQIQVPIGEMSLDIQQTQLRIKEAFHNDLFKMISQLDTVRSATEIDARKEEKLVLLGPVLERFDNEALDPAIKRIYAIAERAELLPEPPEELRGAAIEIQYISILSQAQRAVGVAPIERFLTVVGNIAPIYPGALNTPNWNELLRRYADDVGVPSIAINTREMVAGKEQQDMQLQQQREAAATGTALVGAGQQLSKTDVGGGANALQTIMGNA
jgi:hypothetical protein